MAVTLYDRVRAATTSIGTGSITPGDAVSGYRDFTVVDEGVTVPYLIVEGSAWEVGSGVYSGGELTRDVRSSSTGTRISLTGRAQVCITPGAEDLVTAFGGNTPIKVEDYGWTGTADLLTSADIANDPGIGKPVLDGSRVPTGAVTAWTTSDRKDTKALQEAIYAAYAGLSVAGTITWNNVAGRLDLNRELILPNGTVYVYGSILAIGQGMVWAGGGRGSTLAINTAAADSGIWLGSATYSVFRDFTIQGDLANTAALLEMDHLTLGGLETQQNNFFNVTFSSSSGACHRGVRWNRIIGSSGQGDSNTFIGCTALGFDIAAYEIQGNNALGNVFVGGDCQNNSKDGIAIRGGAATVYGIGMENFGRAIYHLPTYTQHTTGGADVHVYSQSGSIPLTKVHGVRSESSKILQCDGPAKADTCQALNADVLPSIYLNYPMPVGVVASAGSTGRTFKCVSNGGLTSYEAWGALQGTTVGSATKAGAGWSVNQWVTGYAFFNRATSGFSDHWEIASNTATTVVPTGLGAQTGLPVPFEAYDSWTILGKTAASDPGGWDALGPAGRVTIGNGQGFTTVANSTTVNIGSDIYANANVNDYVSIDGAYRVADNLTGTKIFTVQHCAKITAKANPSPGVYTLTLDVAPNVSITDARGFYGPVLTHGNTKWMDWPFSAYETVQGAVENCSMNYGKVHGAALVTNLIAGRTDWGRSLTSGGVSYYGQAPTDLTPILTAGTTPPTGVAYTTQQARLRKIGIRNELAIAISLSSVGAGGVGDVLLSFSGVNFPTTTPTARGVAVVGVVTWSGGNTPSGPAFAAASATTLRIAKSCPGAGAAVTFLQWSEIGAAFLLQGSFYWHEDQG